MRIRLVLLGLALAIVAQTASAQSFSSEQAEEALAQRQLSAHPAECSRLRRQIDHVEGMRARADALDNPMWEQRMAEQVNVLRGMQAARCPNDVPVDHAGQAFMEFLKLAARGAAAYFTFGMAGF